METQYYVYKYVGDDGEIVYVGYTKDLKQRHYNHHIDSFYHDELWYIECSEKSDALYLKEYLIRKYHPKYNKEFHRNAPPSFNFVLNWVKFTR